MINEDFPNLKIGKETESEDKELLLLEELFTGSEQIKKITMKAVDIMDPTIVWVFRFIGDLEKHGKSIGLARPQDGGTWVPVRYDESGCFNKARGIELDWENPKEFIEKKARVDSILSDLKRIEGETPERTMMKARFQDAVRRVKARKSPWELGL